MGREPPVGPRFLEIADTPAGELATLLVRGSTPSPARMAGWEYRGLNLARWVRLAGADRFVKGFTGDRGYNRRIRRGDRTSPWLPPPRPDPPPFAFFSVGVVDPMSRDNRYLHALLLDYSARAAGRTDPAGALRDYVVALDDADDLLLGRAFTAVGPVRFHTTFFVLERLRPAPPQG